MPVVPGQNITDAHMNDAQLKAVARGNRTSSTSTFTTEVGVLRIDDVPIKASSIYMIAVSGLVGVVGTGSGLIFRLRRSTSGPASTSSTEFGSHRYGNNGLGTDPISSFFTFYLSGGSDETHSWLLTVARDGGSDTTSVSAATQGIHMVPIYLGVQPSDTGVDI
jgi:hypothetical protein